MSTKNTTLKSNVWYNKKTPEGFSSFRSFFLSCKTLFQCVLLFFIYRTDAAVAAIKSGGRNIEFSSFDRGSAVEIAFQSEDGSDDDERSGSGSGKQEICRPAGDEFHSEYRACADKFADGSEQSESNGKPESHSDRIENSLEGGVL